MEKRQQVPEGHSLVISAQLGLAYRAWILGHRTGTGRGDPPRTHRSKIN